MLNFSSPENSNYSFYLSNLSDSTVPRFDRSGTVESLVRSINNYFNTLDRHRTAPYQNLGTVESVIKSAISTVLTVPPTGDLPLVRSPRRGRPPPIPDPPRAPLWLKRKTTRAPRAIKKSTGGKTP